MGTSAGHSRARTKDRKGFFEAADKGTLFLDEITEMSLTSQVELLRVLQEGTIIPVGAHSEIPVNVRVIAATNRNLAREVSAGRFREDLFYRIAVLTIEVPPLRERASDIPSLVEHFRLRTSKMIETNEARPIERETASQLSRAFHGQATYDNSNTWFRLCLICITCYERKLAAILKQPANCASIGVLFISASKEGERD